MKTLVLATVISIGAAGVVFADMPGSDWMTKDQVTKKLTDGGYSDVRKLEADDGHWEGDAMKDGKMMEIHVDPHTGEITKSEPKDKDWTSRQASRISLRSFGTGALSDPKPPCARS